MKFGICTGLENLELVERLGYDYIEPSVTGLLALSEEERQMYLEKLKTSRISCEAFNVLFPQEVQLIDGNMDAEALKQYLDRAMAAVHAFGGQVVVFGSGKCRRCPEHLTMGEAYKKLVSIYRAAGDAAAPYGIEVVIEPLSRSETNMICTMAEGAILEADVHHPQVGLLSDFYHVEMNHDRIQDIETIGRLGHTHIAAAAGRKYPVSEEGEEFEAFFRSLRAIGYEGRVSIEGKTEDMEADGAKSLKLLKELAARTL